MLPLIGGYIELTAPNWYSSTKYPELPYGHKNFDCTSSRFVGDVSLKNKKKKIKLPDGTKYTIYWLEIGYDALTGAVTDPITIVCSNWRNPIIPEVSTGFSFQTKDYDKNNID
jgi:hypothetical protein